MVDCGSVTYSPSPMDVGIALIDTVAVMVTDYGYFRAPIPPVADGAQVAAQAEVLWLLSHGNAVKYVSELREV